MPLSSPQRDLKSLKARASNAFMAPVSVKKVKVLEGSPAPVFQNTRLADIAVVQIVGSFVLAMVYLLVTHTKF